MGKVMIHRAPSRYELLGISRFERRNEPAPSLEVSADYERPWATAWAGRQESFLAAFQNGTLPGMGFSLKPATWRLTVPAADLWGES
jgi:hypothetical protein